MTIIISASNSKSVIQFSDRRLSSNGRVIDEHSNKATAFTCANGRFAVGFTGLAKVFEFSLQSWLVTALHRCATPDGGAIETAQRLIYELDLLLSTHPRIKSLHNSVKRLTILFSGYLYRDGRPFVANIMISNYQKLELDTDLSEAEPRFHMEQIIEKEFATKPSTLIQYAGAWGAVTSSDNKILSRILETFGSTKTIMDAGVSIVRQIASRPTSANTVGKEVATIVVPSDLREPVWSTVRLAKGRDEQTLVDCVVVQRDANGNVGCMVVRNPRVKAAVPTHDRSGISPELGPNEKCSCGSGLRFRHCHGAKKTKRRSQG